MTVHRLIVVGVAVLVACVLAVAGCSSAITAVTTVTTGPAVNATIPVTAEPVQLFPVVADGKLGYINAQGVIAIPPQFEPWPYSEFAEGLAPVSVGVGEKFGYIDTTGAMVIQPRFDIADPFSGGLAAVVGDNGLWGFIDKSGSVVVPTQYEQHPGPFSDGLCAVMVDERLEGGRLQNEYIDKTGTVMIGAFEWSTSFSEGMAAVGFGNNDALKWGYIDKTGAFAIPMEHEAAAIYPFAGGLARFDPKGGPISPSYLDRTGKVIWQGQ